MPLPGGHRVFVSGRSGAADVELLVRRQNSLQRVLSHTGKTLDDVINCPISRDLVRGYYKLSCDIDRRSETIELERQWNPLGRYGTGSRSRR